MLNSADNIYAITGAYTLIDIQYMNSASGISSGLITSVTLGITSTTNSSSTSIDMTSSTPGTPSNGGGGRVGGRPFWLW